MAALAIIAATLVVGGVVALAAAWWAGLLRPTGGPRRDPRHRTATPLRTTTLTSATATPTGPSPSFGRAGLEGRSRPTYGRLISEESPLGSQPASPLRSHGRLEYKGFLSDPASPDTRVHGSLLVDTVRSCFRFRSEDEDGLAGEGGGGPVHVQGEGSGFTLPFDAVGACGFGGDGGRRLAVTVSRDGGHDPGHPGAAAPPLAGAVGDWSFEYARPSSAHRVQQTLRGVDSLRLQGRDPGQHTATPALLGEAGRSVGDPGAAGQRRHSPSPSGPKQFRGYMTSGAYVDHHGTLLTDASPAARFCFSGDDGAVLSLGFDDVERYQFRSETLLEVYARGASGGVRAGRSEGHGPGEAAADRAVAAAVDPSTFSFKFFSPKSAAVVRQLLVEVFPGPPTDSFYDRFTRGRLLKTGGFGSVFECTGKQRLGADLVVKIVENVGMGAGDRLDALLQEVEIMCQLQHEHIVQFDSYFVEQDKLFILMEYMRGGELFGYISSYGPCSVPECGLVMRQILGALAYLHSRRIIHRDLKLDNVLLKERNTLDVIKLADFGVSRVYGGRRTETACVGTPEYFAPEQLSTGYTTKIDVWAAGCIMYTVLTKQYPFGLATDRMAREELFSRVQEGRVDLAVVPEPARDCLSRLLCVDPRRRPSPKELLRLDLFRA